MIMLDRDHLDVLDITARRNAFGRQVSSFEADVQVQGAGAMRAVFIRAPWVDQVGEGVDVLAEVDGHPVAVRQGNVLAVAFHPELTGDGRLHEWLVDRIRDQTAKEAA
jgi:5'-phosphate synthase pdxT subunit